MSVPTAITSHKSPMPFQVVFITGAPELKSLEWDSATLLDAFTGPVARFAGISKDKQHSELSTSAEPTHAAWRSLRLSRQHLPTGYSQMNCWFEDYKRDVAFFVPANLSSESASYNGEETDVQLFGQGSTAESVEQVLSQFYEHSFAVHADTLSSQISAHATQSQLDESSDDSFTSYEPQPFCVRPTLPPSAHLSTLGSIPNADYLQSIQPQTMTVNLLVGIITVSAPRALNTRRGAAVDIVEFLVGDDSKSGFGINYWLDPVASETETDSRGVRNTRSSRTDSKSNGGRSKGNEKGAPESGVRSILNALRPQDIVLLTNVALSSFRSRVYGQSLRRGLTKIHLLFRQRVDRFDVGGCFSVADLEGGGEKEDVLLGRARTVREWVTRFVGPGVVVVRKGRQARKGEGRIEVLKEVLPPDTQ